MISHARLAELAADAYTAPAAVIRDDVHFTVTEIDGEVVIAFRGTVLSNIEDIARDIQARPRLDPAIWHVHEGFWFGASYVVLDVLLAIQGRPFHLTGHSLGGALAQVVGAMLAARGIKAKSIVVFGSPRVGFHDFCQALDGIDLTIYRKGNDLVTTVPVYVPDLFPYEHARGLREIGSALRPFVNIEDHASAGYVAAVRALSASLPVEA